MMTTSFMMNGAPNQPGRSQAAMASSGLSYFAKNSQKFDKTHTHSLLGSGSDEATKANVTASHIKYK